MIFYRLQAVKHQQMRTFSAFYSDYHTSLVYLFVKEEEKNRG